MNTVESHQELLLVLGELTIIMFPHNQIAHYIGTRMQLEAEGLIPARTKWPDGFKNDTRWEAGNLNFLLRRQRPKGAKGRRRDFLDCDCWCLFMEPAGSSYKGMQDLAVKMKAKELQQMRYDQTREGQAARSREFDLYWAAKNDESFQVFKALFPCLVPPPWKQRAQKA